MFAPADRLPRLIALGAALVALVFAAVTQHAWEDYYITFRASLNLATGQGLVFQPGERVHTFTSPLGTLLPALFAVGGGENVAVRALWCFRVVSAAALGGAVWLAARSMQRAGLVPIAIVGGCLAWILDAKTIDFSINGMETALLVFFVVLTWRAFAEGPRPLSCGIALAGLQWTRPDGCVFFAAIAAAWLVLHAKAGADSRAAWRSAWRGVVIGIGLYLPWILFAWVYYGTPVPHTIAAKVSHYAPGELLPALALYPWRLLFGHVALHDVFKPAYFFFGGWPAVIEIFARVIAVGAAGAWLLPVVQRGGRIASLAFFLGGFYVEYIPRSPWYYPGWEALGFLAWAYLIDAGARWREPSPAPTFTRIGVAVLISLQAGVLGAVAIQMRAQQAIIEDGQRTMIGRWLRDHAAAGDRVYLEPLGYIGFFSQLKTLDYPGLASPEVVAARRANHRSHAQIIATLHPEWLVLRPDQVRGIAAENPVLLEHDYALVRSFDVRAAVDAVRILPGRGYLDFDALYLVFHSRAPR